MGNKIQYEYLRNVRTSNEIAATERRDRSWLIFQMLAKFNVLRAKWSAKSASLCADRREAKKKTVGTGFQQSSRISRAHVCSSEHFNPRLNFRI